MSDDPYKTPPNLNEANQRMGSSDRRRLAFAAFRKAYQDDINATWADNRRTATDTVSKVFSIMGKKQASKSPRREEGPFSRPPMNFAGLSPSDDPTTSTLILRKPLDAFER
jgi:hypothetical protein